MDLHQSLACHGIAGAAKGIIIFSLIVLFDVGGLKTMLLANPNTYIFYGAAAAVLASLTAVIEIILFVCLKARENS